MLAENFNYETMREERVGHYLQSREFLNLLNDAIEKAVDKGQANAVVDVAVNIAETEAFAAFRNDLLDHGYHDVRFAERHPAGQPTAYVLDIRLQAPPARQGLLSAVLNYFD